MMTDNRISVGFKSLWLSVALAALTGLAMGCAENVGDGQERAEDGQTAVTFGAQTRRSTTRAGIPGDITTTTLQSGAHKDAGFGVFAYYNNNGLYDGTGHPNFMYNLPVRYDGATSKWTYSPVMYWPNEHGATAESESLDRLSFFSYAPWVGVTSATGAVTGDATKGIVGMTRNSANGDPALRYVTSWTPADGVDLLWGTDADDGLPHLDLTKPVVNDKITFTMRHALAKLNLQVDADADLTDGNTRVWVRSVKLTGIAPQGELCLNNTLANVPRWSTYGGGTLAGASVTIHDGRYDGQEGLYVATGETPTGLNPVVVQSASYGDAALTAGVTHTTVNLLDGDQSDAVYVIPTGGPMNVTITYDVETETDVMGYLSDGVTHGKSVQNAITTQAVLPALEAGKAYTVKLHLGLMGVKFDATINPEWDDTGNPVDVDLSENEIYNPLKTPLTLEACQGGATVTFNLSGSKYVRYSLDGGKTWEPEPYVSGTPIKLAKTGDKVSFKGGERDYSGSRIVVSDGDCSVYGNVMSLVYSDNSTTMTSLQKEYCFSQLFYGQSHLVSSKNLVLPATKLTDHCYYAMFENCTNLRDAPALPATTLASNCYNSMFYGCTSLTTAPELPATTLAGNCYYYMFQDCTSLTTAPALPAETLQYNCYYYMFEGCTSLTTAPELPATTLANYCYCGMFQDCTSLTSAPALPVETLTYCCYGSMFEGCTSLTTAPELPATTLANYCYNEMFRGCTSLTTAPELPAETMAQNCYEYMFSGCTSLTNVPSELPATTLAKDCYKYMFRGCTSLTTAPELPATDLVSGCYNYMFEDCSNLNYIKALFITTPVSSYDNSYTNRWVKGVAATGTFVKSSAATWNETGEYAVPDGWTVTTE